MREDYSDPAINYRFDVHDQNGNVPPDTELSRRLRSPQENSPNSATRTMGSGYSRMLKPGESRSDICDVGVWYDLSQPGTYTIQARDGTALGQKAWVKSNAVTVTVVPAGTSVSESSRSPSQALGPPFSLTLWISPHVTGFKPGEVYVEVITENTSNHKLFLWTERLSTEQAGSVYKVDIHDSNGMSPPEIEWGAERRFSTRRHPQRVPPQHRDSLESACASSPAKAGGI